MEAALGGAAPEAPGPAQHYEHASAGPWALRVQAALASGYAGAQQVHGKSGGVSARGLA